jgi:hypothetical protein
MVMDKLGEGQARGTRIAGARAFDRASDCGRPVQPVLTCAMRWEGQAGELAGNG